MTEITSLNIKTLLMDIDLVKEDLEDESISLINKLIADHQRTKELEAENLDLLGKFHRNTMKIITLSNALDEAADELELEGYSVDAKYRSLTSPLPPTAKGE